jgi:release factor glutamine methyltransferase
MSTELREWNVVSMLEWGTSYFKQKNIPDPRHSIEWLLAETLQVKRLDLYLNFDRPLSQTELDRLRPLIKRRARHEPLQYITGSTTFMNAHIRVTPDVLIPRIETEQLVELILNHHPSSGNLSILDIGTGSGCIPVAVKMERPGWTVTGLDISPAALAVAKENAASNNTDIHFLAGDILQWENLPATGPYDVIVSNPPYVLPEEKAGLEPQVAAYEPSLALFCDDLEQMYGSIVRFAESRLTDGGILYLEVHELHADRVASLLDHLTWKTEIRRDYEGKNRFVLSTMTTRS